MANTKKRKSTGDIDEGKAKPVKQPRKTLDAFFTPQATTSCLQPDGEIVQEHVVLNEEQISVLRMAVNEGKSVFFTGAAGTRFCAMAGSTPLIALDRYRKVTAFESYNCGPS